MAEADGSSYGGLVGNVTHSISNFVGEESVPIAFGYPDLAQRASVVLSFRVVCAGNYYGPDCAQFCVNNCTCNPGYTGEFCETNINDCLRVNCSGNGQCLDGDNDYTCVCNPGYTGKDCDMNINKCETMGITCNERVRCLGGINNFTCNCNPGFTGELCQTNIDDCVGVNCSGNGECLDGVDSFTCQCSPGFSGSLCTEGASHACLHNYCM